ncbi:MAG TPA: ribbon-helix-helix protein, CopG family [Bryobacteraceae bacterium]|nr:ribbon-helix-helix protein, CopG family [Bryobacteraceae bacterium]
MEKQNVTLSLPKPLLRKFRVIAAKRNVSMSSLMEDLISRLVLDEDEDDYEARGKRLIERMKNSPGRGFGDHFTWDRNEMYERVR